jgi:hypothetical protein
MPPQSFDLVHQQDVHAWQNTQGARLINVMLLCCLGMIASLALCNADGASMRPYLAASPITAHARTHSSILTH